MRRSDLTEATLHGWARLDAAQRQRFFEALLKAALRLDQLALRAWLRRRLKNPPLAEPIDPARFTISDADMALLLGGGGRSAGRSCRRAGQGRGRWRLEPAGKRSRQHLPSQCPKLIWRVS
jgi:hypothetical protein